MEKNSYEWRAYESVNSRTLSRLYLENQRKKKI